MKLNLSASVAFIFVSSVTAGGVEILSQQSAVNTSAIIWPVPMINVLDQHINSRQSQEVGDRLLESKSEARFETVAVNSDSTLIVRRTNTAASDVFWMQSALSMRSQGELPAGHTHITTKGIASANVTLQLRLDTPFHFRILTSGESPSVFPVSGTVSIRLLHSQPVAQLNWSSTASDSQESQGNLPAGVYQIDFSTGTETEGVIASFLQSPIGIAARTTAIVTMTPQETTPTPRAALHLRRRDDEVLLEMSGLQPGTFYYIERSEALTPELWSIFANFSAAGTNAVWIDPFNAAAGSVFYRVRY